MPTGLGGFDAEGVWQFGEDDTEVLMSDLLNKGMQSLTDQLVLDRARLSDLEFDSGWIAVTYQNGWADAVPTEPVQVRLKNGIVYLRGRCSSGTSGTAFTLPPGARPGQITRFVVRHGGLDDTAVVTIATNGDVTLSSGEQPNLAAVFYPADQ